MASADDLTPLFTAAADRGEAVGYRQGVLTAWNAGTAANTVVVGGTPLTNLPVLNTAGLTAGVVVAVLAAGARRDSWLILGRLTIPV